MWIARDKCGLLYLFENRPTKIGNAWDVNNLWDDHFMELDPDLFPDAKWEDEEPIEVTINVKE